VGQKYVWGKPCVLGERGPKLSNIIKYIPNVKILWGPRLLLEAPLRCGPVYYIDSQQCGSVL